MVIPLNEFEELVDERIISRGLAYFLDGAISDFIEISLGQYEALVSGTEKYIVQLEISDNTLTEHNCDCPYDMGPICKHVVAAIFYLRQDEMELNQVNFTIPQKEKTMSIEQQIKAILQTISHNELIEFVQENSKNDKKFRNQLLAAFGHLNQNLSKAYYQQQVHSILQTAAGRDRWIKWSDMKYIVNATEPFLENAKKYFANNNFENVFFISSALLEEMTEAFQYGDDSSGHLSYFVDSALDLLSKLTQVELPKTLKEEMFEYCIATFNQKLFDGWDWHLEMLHFASKLIEDESSADIILNCLDAVNSDFDRRRAQFFKLELLRRFKDEKEVEKFTNTHISNSLIRTNEIERAFADKHYERVIKLSEDGIKCDEKSKPGLVKDWYNWLLKVAQAQNDTPKIIDYSRFLFIDNFYPKQDYYQILKDNIGVSDWHPFLEELLKELISKNSFRYNELIRKIYIKEAWWDRLLIMLKQNLTLDNIQHNEQYLEKDYAPELVELYSESIITYVGMNVGRKHYQTACRYLRRMKKLGGKDKVKELIDILRKRYPQRPALMDELNRV